MGDELDQDESSSSKSIQQKEKKIQEGKDEFHVPHGVRNSTSTSLSSPSKEGDILSAYLKKLTSEAQKRKPLKEDPKGTLAIQLRERLFMHYKIAKY